MSILHKAFRRSLTIFLVAAFTVSCSAQARKDRFVRRGEEYFKTGEYDKAKLEYTNALRMDPKDPGPFEKMGIMWLEEGAPLRAAPFLLRAKELAPARASVRIKLAEVYMAVGGLEEARNEALEAVEIEPGNEDAVFILTDAARTPDELARAEQELGRDNGRESVKLHLAAASVAARKNDPPAMQAALLRAVATDPKSPLAHLALGRFYLFQNNKDDAVKQFKLAIGSAPLRSPAHLQYAEFQAQNGAVDEAVTHLREVVKQAPDFLTAWVLLANYASSKSVEEALPLLENVFRRDAQNFDGRMLESELYTKKGDSKKSVEILKQVDAAYPEVAAIKLQLARSLSRSGDVPQALATLEHTVAISPNNDDAVLLLAELNLRSGNLAPVVKAMEEFLKKTPGSYRAQIILADAYRGLGRSEDAAAILRKQVEAAPLSGEAHFLLGTLLRQEGKLDEARAEFEKAYTFATDKIMALEQLVDLDLGVKDYDKALQRVNALAEHNSESPVFLLLQGKIFLAKGDWAKAEEALQKALQLKGDIAMVSRMLVATYLASNQLPKAIARTEEFLQKSPKDPAALMILALLYNEVKDFNKARDTYERLLAITPNVLAMNNLAYIYLEQLNDLDKAQDWANRARTLEPTNPAVGDTVAWVSYKRGDYRQAATLLKDITGKMPDNPEIQYHWGMASYMMGNTEAARTALQFAVNSATDFPAKEDAKQHLILLDDARAEQLSVTDLETLVKNQPNDPLALARLAAALAKNGAFAEAAAMYERVLQVNSEIPAATLSLAELYAGPLQKKDRALELAKKARELSPDNYRATALQARLAFEAGNYTWAYSLLHEAVRRAPGDPALLSPLAWAAYALGKTDEAQKTMEEVIKNAPETAEGKEAKLFLAMAEVAKGDVAAGEPQVADALRRNEEFAPALMLLAAIQAQKGEVDAAKATYERVLTRFPEFAPAQKLLSQLLSADPAAAARAYDLAVKARKALPEDPEVARNLAILCYSRKEYARTIQLMQETARKTPLGARDLFYLGMSQNALKQRSSAQESLKRATDAGLTGAEATQAKEIMNDLTNPPR